MGDSPYKEQPDPGVLASFWFMLNSRLSCMNSLLVLLSAELEDAGAARVDGAGAGAAELDDAGDALRRCVP